MGKTTMDHPTVVTTTVDRRRFLALSTAAGAGLAVASTLSWPATEAFARSRPRTPNRPLWGAYCRPTGSQSWEDALASLEREAGRTMSITRHYYRWDEAVPDDYARSAAAGGRVPFVSIHAFTTKGVYIPWSEITAGIHDEQLKIWANNLQSWGAKGYLNFHHEPENDLACGTGADFQAAFAHVQAIFDAEGVTNFIWGVSLMASTLNGGHGGADQWLPDPSLYRVLVVDGYNRFPSDAGASHWRSFEEIFTPAHGQAQARGKHLLIGEYGSVEQTAGGDQGGSPTAKAQWLGDAMATMKTWPEVVGAIYSHTTAVYGGQVMDYWADSSAPALVAFTDCGHDTFFS